jgi:predicted amidohydrolase YtcJ
MHVGVVNTRGLEVLGINSSYKNPPGGQARRMPNSTEPTGILEEKSFFGILPIIFKKFSPKKLFGVYTAAQKYYARNGMTTVTDGKTDPKSLALLSKIA